MTAIAPVINPPQVDRSWASAPRARCSARPARKLVEKSVMTLTLAADHRILYGADAAMFH